MIKSKNPSLNPRHPHHLHLHHNGQNLRKSSSKFHHLTFTLTTMNSSSSNIYFNLLMFIFNNLLLLLFILFFIMMFHNSNSNLVSCHDDTMNVTYDPVASLLSPKSKPYHPNRPFFNIAHMVNSIDEIDPFLDRGANAIETDIYFAPNATPVFTFHGYPCDCFRRCGERERVPAFLERIRALTTPSSPIYDKRLLLILLDLKLSRISHSAKALAGQQMASVMLRHLYNSTTRDGSPNGSRIRAILSLNHVFDYDFVLGFTNELELNGRDWLAQQYIGWDVGMNDPVFAIESMWKRLDMVTYNIWQGDGRSNCMSPFYNLGRLSQIIRRRDNPSFFAVKNYIRKVYQWTVDLTVNIRTALRSNVDAIITNHPERVANVLHEREFVKRFRMAEYSDSPWERIYTKPQKPQTSSMLNKPTLSLKLMNGAGDIMDSLSKFLTDAILNQTPLKYLLLQYYQQQQRKQQQKQKLAQFRISNPGPNGESMESSNFVQDYQPIKDQQDEDQIYFGPNSQHNNRRDKYHPLGSVVQSINNIFINNRRKYDDYDSSEQTKHAKSSPTATIITLLIDTLVNLLLQQQQQQQ